MQKAECKSLPAVFAMEVLQYWNYRFFPGSFRFRQLEINYPNIIFASFR